MSEPLKCGKCGSANVWRTQRKTLPDRGLSLLGLWPYRCHECNTRFRRRRESLEAESAPGTEKRKERRRLDKIRRLRVIILFAISLTLFALLAHYLILREPGIPAQ